MQWFILCNLNILNNLNLIIKITLKNNQFLCETTSEKPKYLIWENDKAFLPPIFADETIVYMKTKFNHVFFFPF